MRTLSLISDTSKPCGIEAFARGLAARLGLRDGTDRHNVCPITGQPGEILVLRRALAVKDCLIVNLPMVAWKQRIVAPVRAMAAARRLGKDVVLVLHEWDDLDWKRKATYLAYLPLATRVLFSSPCVWAQFNADMATHLTTRHRGLVPIPPNLAYPETLPVTPIAQQIMALKNAGKLVLGHFGAIYPKKQSTEVLEIAARLKANGQHVHCVFIGDFIGGATVDVRAQFEGRVQALGLSQNVLVTGYIGPSAEVFAAIEACDVLVYALPEGLTARRGSVLACLQTGKPVFVNGPRHTGEFDQHPSFAAALGQGGLRLLAPDATPDDFADAIAEPAARSHAVASVDFQRAWDDAVEVMLGARLPASVIHEIASEPALR